jgi:hypothetical protein
MAERRQPVPESEAMTTPMLLMASAAGEAEAAFVALEATVSAGGLAAGLDAAALAADRLLERLAGLSTVVSQITDPTPWRELLGEVEAAAESMNRLLSRLPGSPDALKGGLPTGPFAGEPEAVSFQNTNALTALAPVLGPDFAARAAAADAAEMEAASTEVPPAPLLYGAPRAQIPPTVTVAQSGPAIPAFAMPAVSVTVQTPPLGADYWHGLFRMPGFEEALRQFLAEWAYHQSQQANPGPSY